MNANANEETANTKDQAPEKPEPGLPFQDPSANWRVFRMNDCDWYIARSLEEAKAKVQEEYVDWAHIDEDARELTDEELKKHKMRLDEWTCDCGATLNQAGVDFRFNGRAWEHCHGYPIGHVEMRKEISFQEELARHLKAGPKVGIFASTEF